MDDGPLIEMHACIGRCLDRWSQVEFAVHLLFLSLNDRHIRANDPLLASFEANRSFNAKRQTLRTYVMSDDRAEGLFRDRFGSLDPKLGVAHEQRNEIAHFKLVRHYDAKAADGTIMLHQFGSFTGRFFHRDKTPLLTREVFARAESFAELAKRCFRFVTYIRNVRGLLDEHETPFADPERLLDHPYSGPTQPIITIS